MSNFNFDPSKVIVTFGNREFFGPHLDRICHSQFLNLLIVYKQIVDVDFGEKGFTTRTILVEELKEAGMSLSDLDAIAKENTARLLPAVIDDYMGMRVLTNTSGCQGASAVMYSSLVEQTAEEFGTDVYILPSSIHEMILVPVNEDFTVSNLRNMVKAANCTVVQPKEVLSDSVYVYHRDTSEISIA